MARARRKSVLTIDGVEWTVEKLRNLITKDDRVAIRAMLRIYEGQTADEKNMETTLKTNGIGFNSSDADIMSSFVVQYKETKSLSPKQREITRKVMKKYAGQVFRYMQSKHKIKE